MLFTSESRAQTLYTGDGTPTNRSEEIRWLLNRGRFNPAAENTARGTNYSGLSQKPPLAPNALLNNAAAHHSQDEATKNVFQHETVTNSAFYDWAAHHANNVADFADRAIAEGYPLGTGSENIDAGYPTASAAYLGWWNSQGHRENMYDVSRIQREIGLGYFFTSTSTYKHYDTMDLSLLTAANGFFTDTLFFDANTNGLYNDGEGLAGIRIDLKNGTADHTSYDVSSSSGAFAVPLTGINAGVTVQVYLTNTTASTLSLSIPSDYATLQTLRLTTGQKWLWGSFARVTDANAGFRNLTRNTAQPLVLPAVTVATTSGQAVIGWQSQSGFSYRIQWSATLTGTWNDLTTLTGNGGVMSYTDPTRITAAPKRFYRMVVTSP